MSSDFSLHTGSARCLPTIYLGKRLFAQKQACGEHSEKNVFIMFVFLFFVSEVRLTPCHPDNTSENGIYVIYPELIFGVSKAKIGSNAASCNKTFAYICSFIACKYLVNINVCL
jgi:hypothetical protein